LGTAITGFREQAPLPQSPNWIAALTGFPMALSPSIVSTRNERTREAAVSIYGGLFVVGSSEETIRSIRVEALYPD